MKVTVYVTERSYGKVEIEVPDGLDNEEIEELAEEMVDNGEAEIEWGDEIYRDYNV